MVLAPEKPEPPEAGSPEPSETNAPEKKERPYSDTLIIAYCTALATVSAFVYELAFAIQFNIPFSLISINWATIVYASLAILAFVYSFIVFLGLIYSSEPVHKYNTIATILTTVTFIALWVYVVFNKQYNQNMNSTLGFLQIISYGLIITKLRSAKLIELIPREVYIPTLFFFLCPCLLMHYGAYNSVTSSNYYVLNSGSTAEVAVLRIYGERMICAPFDRQKKTLGNSISILPLSIKPTLTWETIGPLHK